MEVLIAAVVIYLASVIAQVMTPGIRPMGFVATALLGLFGAFAATQAGRALGVYEPGQYAGFVGTLIVVLFVIHGYYVFFKRGKSSR